MRTVSPEISASVRGASLPLYKQPSRRFGENLSFLEYVSSLGSRIRRVGSSYRCPYGLTPNGRESSSHLSRSRTPPKTRIPGSGFIVPVAPSRSTKPLTFCRYSPQLQTQLVDGS